MSHVLWGALRPLKNLVSQELSNIKLKICTWSLAWQGKLAWAWEQVFNQLN